MAKTNIAVQEVKKPVGTIAAAAGKATLTAASGTGSNGNMFANTGKEVLYVINTSTDTEYTLKIEAQPDSVLGRDVDITGYAVPAGEIHRFGPFPPDGFNVQSGNDLGKIYFEGSNAALKFWIDRVGK